VGRLRVRLGFTSRLRRPAHGQSNPIFLCCEVRDSELLERYRTLSTESGRGGDEILCALAVPGTGQYRSVFETYFLGISSGLFRPMVRNPAGVDRPSAS
jgi:hypothetical protein